MFGNIGKTKDNPEKRIQDKIVAKLTLLGWFCIETHGNMYQRGLPDIYATHKRYGARWIEVKNPDAYSFTPAQVETFPKLIANGAGVWVLMSDSDLEFSKLKLPCNYWQYC